MKKHSALNIGVLKVIAKSWELVARALLTAES